MGVLKYTVKFHLYTDDEKVFDCHMKSRYLEYYLSLNIWSKIRTADWLMGLLPVSLLF